MKKTIFLKLMRLSVCIVLMSVFVLGTIHFVLINQFIKNAKTQQLNNETQRLQRMTDNLVRNYSHTTHTFYQMYIDELSGKNNCYIIVANKDGNILLSSRNALLLYKDKVLDPKPFEGIINGRVNEDSTIITAPNGMRALAVSRAIRINGAVGFVSMLVNAPLINRETYSMITFLGISAGFAMLLSLILSYFLSMNMSKPIKLLGKQATEIAKGDFGKRSVPSGVAELDELGEAFDKMASELEKQEKSRTAFLANVSHDLRTPMTTISGFVQGILDDTIPQEKEKEYLKVVLSETNRMADLINLFLDASRYETREELTVSDFDINEMLRAVILQFENSINDKKIKVNFDVDKRDAQVSADEHAIRRVVVNLMDNAVKFCNDGGTISVNTMHKDKKVFVSIENTGEGISKEDIKYIWDRFYKTDKSRVRDKKGVGLGLYIVKSIISHHGEQLFVKSENGVTTFSFSLPILQFVKE